MSLLTSFISKGFIKCGLFVDFKKSLVSGLTVSPVMKMILFANSGLSFLTEKFVYFSILGVEIVSAKLVTVENISENTERITRMKWMRDFLNQRGGKILFHANPHLAMVQIWLAVAVLKSFAFPSPPDNPLVRADGCCVKRLEK